MSRSFTALVFMMALSVSGLFPANASMIDRVSFSQGPMIVVWDGDESARSSDEIVLGGRTAVSTQPVAFAGGGLLEPIQANFSENAASTQSKSFKIASNAPFSIRAELSRANVVDGTFKLSIGDIGENAQIPGTIVQSEIALSTLSTPQIVYAAHRKTARRAGSTVSQAVTFNAEWTPQNAADVTLTVFIP